MFTIDRLTSGLVPTVLHVQIVFGSMFHEDSCNFDGVTPTLEKVGQEEFSMETVYLFNVTWGGRGMWVREGGRGTWVGEGQGLERCHR